MDLVRRMLQYDKAELFIYFDFNSVNRFAGKGVVDHRFEELFGYDDFYDAPASGPARKAFLHDLYERQLRTGVFDGVRAQLRDGQREWTCRKPPTLLYPRPSGIRSHEGGDVEAHRPATTGSRTSWRDKRCSSR